MFQDGLLFQEQSPLDEYDEPLDDWNDDLPQAE
jgi:hypothetical protein